MQTVTQEEHARQLTAIKSGRCPECDEMIKAWRPPCGINMVHAWRALKTQGIDARTGHKASCSLVARLQIA